MSAAKNSTTDTPPELSLRTDSTPPSDSTAQFGIPELVPVLIKARENQLSGNRINLLIPCISERRRSFGGPATALRLIERLASEFEYARIVVTHETESAVDLRNWPDWVVDREDAARRSIAFLGDRNTALSVAADDLFVATFWSTAIYIKTVIARQTKWFPGANHHFAYLIQEYEPAFYAGSARYDLAHSTYSDPAGVIGIFNSRPVADFCRVRGVSFHEQYTFDSLFHPKLQKMRAELGDITKERLILVYGRPEVQQNGFDLIVESLKCWGRMYSHAGEWTLISAGLPHADVPLGGQIVLRSLGTLALEQYAHLLAKCWAGISFSFNGSTSHSAREMVEFGSWLIANQFEYKKQTELPDNITCVEELTPEKVAERLAWCCEQYRPGRTAVVPNLSSAFTAKGEEFPFVDSLLRSWRTK